MPRLKRLKAREVLRILHGYGFEVVSMQGSHAKLVRINANGKKEILIVPMHRDLTTGTLGAICRQASQFIPVEQIRREFMSE